MRILGLARVTLLLACVLPIHAQSAPASRPDLPDEVLVVLNKADATALLVDPGSGSALRTVEVGAGPHEAAASPDGRHVVTANYGAQVPGNTLSILDLHTAAAPRTLDLGPNPRPHGLHFLPDGRRFVVTTEGSRRLLVIGVATGTIEASIPTGANLSHMVALDAAGTRAYVANLDAGGISVLDLAAGALVTQVKTGAGAEGIAVRPGDEEVWVTNRQAGTVSVVATKDLRVLAELACPGFPIRVAFTPRGERALVSCATAGELAVFEASSRKLLRRVATGASEDPAPVGVLVRPDGAAAYVANMKEDHVAEIDLQTYAVRRRLPTGRVPDGMAWVRRTAPSATRRT